MLVSKETVEKLRQLVKDSPKHILTVQWTTTHLKLNPEQWVKLGDSICNHHDMADAANELLEELDTNASK